MYAHFYQLAENPFNLTPDPKYHYINESTREAMASILHGIKARKGFITLIGEAGTGKTTLLKRILDEIEGETQVVFVFNPGVSFDELLEFICMELGMSTDGRRRLQLLDRLNAHLLEQLTAGRNVVVMIDEAQTLDDGVLEELRLLSNLETAKEKILQILLSGQPELEEKLRRPNLRQLRQRIAARATLKPMRPDEVGPYVETRLRSAGAERADFFTPPALRKVWQASRGIPRVVNVVCDNAMMIAFAEGKRRITAGVMAEAIRDLHGQGPGGNVVDLVRGWLATPALRYGAAAVLGLALAVPFALSMSRNGDDNTPQQIADSAAPAHNTPSEVAAAERNVAAPAREPATSAPNAPSDSGAPAALEGRMNGTLRDSVKRAEEVARTTAARLYHSDARAVEPNAVRELHNSGPTANDVETPSTAGAVENRALASLDEPVKFERESQPLADLKADSRGLATLRAPLGDEESGAFAGEQRTANSEGENAKAMPAPQPGQKPVKAGTLALDSSAAAAQKSTPDEAAHLAERAEAAKAAAAREQAARQQAAREQAAREQAAREQVAREQASREQAAREQAAREQSAREQAAREQAAREQAAREQAAREQAAREARASAAAEESVSEPLDTRDPDAAATERLLASAEAAAEARERAGMGAGAPVVAAVAPPASSELRTFGVDPSEPIVGQLVRVSAGDTVWDIAVAYYGTAGPVTLKRILNSNPTIRDPRHLEVGTHIYLPFQRPEQMVLSGSEGSYRILLAVSPERSRLAPVRAWVETFIQGARFDTSAVSGAERSYQLQLVGLPSKEAAMEFAAQILSQHDSRRQHGVRRSA